MNNFQAAVTSGNTLILSKVPGIGKKTAERLIIEMKDKFKKINKDKIPNTMADQNNILLTDAINALIYLGYNSLQAQKAVSRAMSENKEERDLSTVIAYSLQHLR